MATAPNRVTPLRISSAVIDRQTGPRKPRAKWWPWAILSAALLVLVVATAVWRAYERNSISYDTVPVERGAIQAKVTATGNLNAVVDVLVSSQVSGNIKTLYADWNSKVTKGQLIALIDPQIFQAQVDQASATYRSAQAAAGTAQAQIAAARANLSAANATEKNAEAIKAKDVANEINAKAQWERAETLLHEQIMDQQDYDTAKATYEASQAQVTADQAQIDAANKTIESSQASVQVAESQLDAAQAQQRQAQASLDQAQINLAHCQIYAPVDGTVIARRMDIGQTVASTLNPPTIFEIAQDLTKMQVDTNVDESDVGNIAKGQKATFIVDSYPDTMFHAIVADIRKAPIVAQNVVTYDVVLTVDNSDLKLFPGMTANVTILTTNIEDTFKVPNSVLRFRPSAAVLKKAGLAPGQPDKPVLYVLAGKKLVAVPVTFGLTDGKFTAVTSGQLQLGERAVIRASVRGAGANSSQSGSPPMGPRL